MADHGKKRGLDLALMEAAFKRAAYKAVHGTREERSGRFMPTKTPGAPSEPVRELKRLKSRDARQKSQRDSDKTP
jgi:hypothetical protein